jgi:hypothetical protein
VEGAACISASVTIRFGASVAGSSHELELPPHQSFRENAGANSCIDRRLACLKTVQVCRKQQKSQMTLLIQIQTGVFRVFLAFQLIGWPTFNASTGLQKALVDESIVQALSKPCNLAETTVVSVGGRSVLLRGFDAAHWAALKWVCSIVTGKGDAFNASGCTEEQASHIKKRYVAYRKFSSKTTTFINSTGDIHSHPDLLENSLHCIKQLYCKHWFLNGLYQEGLNKCPPGPVIEVHPEK